MIMDPEGGGVGCDGVHGGGGGRGPRGSSLVERKEEECWRFSPSA